MIAIIWLLGSKFGYFITSQPLSMSTGYVCIRKWNAEGYEGLKDEEARTR